MTTTNDQGSPWMPAETHTAGCHAADDQRTGPTPHPPPIAGPYTLHHLPTGHRFRGFQTAKDAFREAERRKWRAGDFSITGWPGEADQPSAAEVSTLADGSLAPDRDASVPIDPPDPRERPAGWNLASGANDRSPAEPLDPSNDPPGEIYGTALADSEPQENGTHLVEVEIGHPAAPRREPRRVWICRNDVQTRRRDSCVYYGFQPDPKLFHTVEFVEVLPPVEPAADQADEYQDPAEMEPPRWARIDGHPALPAAAEDRPLADAVKRMGEIRNAYVSPTERAIKGAMEALQRPTQHFPTAPDLALAYAALAPLVTRAEAQLRVGSVEAAKETLREACRVIEQATATVYRITPRKD